MYYSLMSNGTRLETFDVKNEKELPNVVYNSLFSMRHRGYIKNTEIPDLKGLTPDQINNRISVLGFNIVEGWPKPKPIAYTEKDLENESW